MGSLKEVIIKRKLRKAETGGKNFIPWDRCKTIALVIDSKTSKSKSVIDKFIYEADKVVDVYYLDLDVKESAIKNFITLTKQEKNWLGLPNGKTTAKIVKKKYDLLINASFAELDYASVLTSMIKATCKCGFKSRTNELDLIVSKNNDQSIDKYLEALVNYLKMIKN